MYSPEFFVQTLQNVKKNWTNRVFEDPKLKTIANRYIDGQTAFAEMLIKNTEEMTKYFQKK